MGKLAATIKHIPLGAYRNWRHYPRGAARSYATLVSMHPNVRRWRFQYAVALNGDKQYQKALEEIEVLLKKYPNQESYQQVKLNALRGLGRYEESLAYCQQILETRPRDRVALHESADDLFALGKYQEAVAVYKATLNLADLDTKTRTLLYHSLGRAVELSGEGSPDDYYQKAIESSDNQTARELGIGVLHRSRGWLDLAKDEFEKQAVAGSQNPNLYFQMGVLYSKLNDASQAAEAYKKFIEYSGDAGDIDEKLVVFDAYMGRNYACSPRAIYEEMLRNPAYKGYKFVWVFRSTSLLKHWSLYLNRRTQVVKFKSKEYFRAYAKAKYWVTNSRLAFVLKTNDQQVYIQCWHGTPLKRIGHSVVDESKGSKYDKTALADLYDHDTKRMDYFLSPSKTASEYFEDAFAFKALGKPNIIVEEGYPRNDFLNTFTNKDVTRVKKRLGIPSDKKVLLYAPTWRDDQHTQGTGYTYKTQADFDYLQKKLGDDWVILFRAHYFIANGFDFGKYENFIYNVSEVDDVNDLYIISDVLMTDYSSVFFDYANLNRPIIFFMYDLEHYAKDLRGFYIDLKELPGDIVKTEEEITAILSDLGGYESKHSDTYTTFTNRYTYLDDGKAAERVLKRVIR